VAYGGARVRVSKPRKPARKKRKSSADKSSKETVQSVASGAVNSFVQPRRAKLAATSWARYLYIGAGFVSLVLGIVGIVTPVLPTTPFILLSGYCFARGSERFHTWIMRHKYFGPMIRAFRDEKRIPLKAKIFATVMIVVTMTATALVVKKIFAVAAMASVGVAVVIYIWTFKH
jgi:uncharacterized membrane protein YbaN (DUF454 family)